MTGPRFEIFLARLYTDAEARSRFLKDPELMARAEGLNEDEILAALKIDREGLLLAGESFDKKRSRKSGYKRQ